MRDETRLSNKNKGRDLTAERQERRKEILRRPLPRLHEAGKQPPLLCVLLIKINVLRAINARRTERGMMMVYGYARCSTNESKQDIQRQVRELKTAGAEE